MEAPSRTTWPLLAVATTTPMLWEVMLADTTVAKLTLEMRCSSAFRINKAGSPTPPEQSWPWMYCETLMGTVLSITFAPVWLLNSANCPAFNAGCDTPFTV